MKKSLFNLFIVAFSCVLHSQGFDPNAINFGLPNGGNSTTTINNSYYFFTNFFQNTADTNGSQLWYLWDMNGDDKMDLLVYQEKEAGSYRVPGTTGNRFWKVYINNGTSFNITPINWALPVGGYITNNVDNSFNNTVNSYIGGNEVNGSQLWYLTDINGDNKYDLLVFQEKEAGNYRVPGTSENRYWKVYLNNGFGFDTTPINWSLPAGGNITAASNNSFDAVSNSYSNNSDINGSQFWYLMDMNGDNKSDLLVYQEKEAGNYRVPGASGSRYWKVYFNNGKGFDTTPLNWTLPEGGHITTTSNNSYVALSFGLLQNAADVDGSQVWYSMDFNGDRKLDLLVYLERTDGFYGVPGSPGNRYWKVYLNNGSGFNSTPINWSLPSGGTITVTGNYSYVNINSNTANASDIEGSQLWYVTDMDGDSKSDLLVYREKEAGDYRVPGTTGSRYWKVYANNGAGFETSAVNWALPAGGNITTTNDNSYYSAGPISGSTNDLDGSELWSLVDMNGDYKSDLIVYQEKQAGTYSVPGTTNNRYWKVYLNNSSPLSTDENPLADNQITIYPNPLTDFSTVTFDEVQENTTVNIFDLTGKKVMTDTCAGNDYIVKKGNLQPGLYVLQLIDASKKITTKKLVIE